MSWIFRRAVSQIELSISGKFVAWNEQGQVTSIWHLDLHDLSRHNAPRNSKVEVFTTYAAMLRISEDYDDYDDYDILCLYYFILW